MVMGTGKWGGLTVVVVLRKGLVDDFVILVYSLSPVYWFLSRLLALMRLLCSGRGIGKRDWGTVRLRSWLERSFTLCCALRRGLVLMRSMGCWFRVWPRFGLWDWGRSWLSRERSCVGWRREVQPGLFLPWRREHRCDCSRMSCSCDREKGELIAVRTQVCGIGPG